MRGLPTYADREIPADHPFITIYCRGCGEPHDVPSRCGHRFCPVCSRQRAADIRHHLEFIVENLPLRHHEVLKMITLSTRNCQDLSLGIKHLVASFRRLRQTRLWKRHVSGGATIIEITGKQGNYHPHLHILCYSSWFPWDKLLTQWRISSGGQGVYIQDIPLRKALYYVTKYITKLEAPQDCLDYIGDELKKYRLFQRFGSWHDLRIPQRERCWICSRCEGRLFWTEFQVRRWEKAFDSS